MACMVEFGYIYFFQERQDGKVRIANVAADVRHPDYEKDMK